MSVLEEGSSHCYNYKTKTRRVFPGELFLLLLEKMNDGLSNVRFRWQSFILRELFPKNEKLCLKCEASLSASGFVLRSLG